MADIMDPVSGPVKSSVNAEKPPAMDGTRPATPQPEKNPEAMIVPSGDPHTEGDEGVSTMAQTHTIEETHVPENNSANILPQIVTQSTTFGDNFVAFKDSSEDEEADEMGVTVSTLSSQSSTGNPAFSSDSGYFSLPQLNSVTPSAHSSTMSPADEVNPQTGKEEEDNSELNVQRASAEDVASYFRPASSKYVNFSLISSC